MVNYSQFLNMVPEAFLVLELLILFVADFCLTNDKEKPDGQRYEDYPHGRHIDSRYYVQDMA